MFYRVGFKQEIPYLARMKNFNLTTEEVLELRNAHKRQRKRNASAAYKINAIILLGTGWTFREVSEALLLDDETLRNYVKKYRTGGIKALIQTLHQGRQAHLTREQSKALCDALESKIFLTAAEVVQWIDDTFSISYSVSGVRDLLHRLEYEYKKPKLVPGNPNREDQDIFVEYYEDFMEKKSENEEVLFVDAVHPEHNTLAAYGWIKRGQKRTLPTNSGRQRLNLHGAINAETQVMTVIESTTIDADSTIELLETLNQRYSDSARLHIILDNARYHYSSKVKAYIAENKRINLVFLPSYSPELNLIERVWKYFKKNVLYNQYYESLQTFREACIEFFQGISRHRKALASIMDGGFEGF